jgi:hypothetical protein
MTTHYQPNGSQGTANNNPGGQNFGQNVQDTVRPQQGVLGGTTFITKQGLFCYRVMPFGLKNAGATYLLDRGLVNKMFHDMIGTTMEGIYRRHVSKKPQARAAFGLFGGDLCSAQRV